MYHIIGGDGREYGPVSGEQLLQWLAEGRANQQTPVRAAGSTDWRPLGTYPELAMPPAAPAPMAAPQPVGTSQVPTYLAQAILVTLCCCLPFGIPAIVFAAQVNSKVASGDMAGAWESSRKAKMWCWVAFGLGLASNIITGAIYGLLMAAG